MSVDSNHQVRLAILVKLEAVQELGSMDTWQDDPDPGQKCGSAFGADGVPSHYPREFWTAMETLATSGDGGEGGTGWLGANPGDSTLQPYQKGGGEEMIWFAQNIDGTGYPMACVQSHADNNNVGYQLCDAPKPLVVN